MSPICVACGRTMRCKKNGFVIELMSNAEKTVPYRKHSADKYECPECGIEVVIDLGIQPLVQSFDEDYESYKADLKVY